MPGQVVLSSQCWIGERGLAKLGHPDLKVPARVVHVSPGGSAGLVELASGNLISVEVPRDIMNSWDTAVLPKGEIEFRRGS